MTAQPPIRFARHERSLLSKLLEGLFILLLLTAVAGCDFYAARMANHLRSARHWPGVTGVMRESRVQRAGWNRKENLYVVDLDYRYTVNDTTYAATNQLPDVFSSAYAAGQATGTLRAHGSYLPVFYNPLNPAESILSQAWPRGLGMCLAVLASATLLAVAWFGWRLARLAAGDEDLVMEAPSTVPGDDLAGLPAGPWSKPLRWLFALMGAASCWWIALTIYRDWGLSAAGRRLPSAELIFMMEFILAHSGMMVPGLLATPNQTRQSKIKQTLFLCLIYLTFATSIAAAAQSFRLFVMFSTLLISRWVGLLFDPKKARQRQMTRSVEAFLILLLSIGVCAGLLKQPFEVALIVYFWLIGLTEITLPARKKSWFQPQTGD